MLKKISLFLLFSGMFQLYGQENSLIIHDSAQKEPPFLLEASYIGDVYANIAGGLKTGGGYMGMGNLKIGFDTEKARWWKGGCLFINGATIHGKSLSENFTGDLQVASNIDAGTHVYLHEFWFRQEFKTASFTVGLQDMNAEFMVCENGAEFINSSFGVPPVVSENIPVPIFPLTGLGISAKWNISPKIRWQAAVFDGCQTPFENNPHNLSWRVCKNEGLLLIAEFHANIRIHHLDGTYKIGYIYHSGFKELEKESQEGTSVFRHSKGIYALIDQTVMHNEEKNRRIGLFTQIAFCRNNKMKPTYYFGLGANCHGIFNPRGHDILGLAIAHVHLNGKSRPHETALELFYKWKFNENVSIQPDLQYIIHPSLTEKPLKNALACLFRLHIDI